MKRITVNLNNSYDILLGDNLFSKTPKLIMPFCESKKILVITDSNVEKLYGKKLINLLEKNGFETCLFSFSAGEESKNNDTLFEILDFAFNNGFTRNDIFIGLGGGVVGDITGLSASLYMRGVSYISIPTTLLSAVDSSIGGKTAVNMKSGKNVIGTFNQPALVICDTKIIKNLSENIFAEGLGEVIKYGVIKDKSILDTVKKGETKGNIDDIIEKCLNIKREVVEPDEFDNLGIRNVLNAGHTIGHAIEVESGFDVPHGKAVALGLVIEANIANKLGLCGKTTVTEIEKAVKTVVDISKYEIKPETIATLCLKDKKNKDSRITFLLPEKIGKMKEVLLSKEELTSLFESL